MGPYKIDTKTQLKLRPEREWKEEKNSTGKLKTALPLLMIIMGNCRVCVLVGDNVGIPPSSLLQHLLCAPQFSFTSLWRRKRKLLSFSRIIPMTCAQEKRAVIFFFGKESYARAERIQFQRSLIRGKRIFFSKTVNIGESPTLQIYTVDDSQPAIKCSYEIRIFFLFPLLEP